MNANNSLNRQLDIASTNTVVVVKTGLTDARSMRDATISLILELAEHEKRRGYLLLVNPGLSQTFLKQEVSRIKAALVPNVANRLFLVVANELNVIRDAHLIPEADLEILRRQLMLKADSRTAIPAASKQDEIFLVMLHQWISGQGPMTSKWLEDTVGCNYRTVVSAIDGLGQVVSRRSDRSVSLGNFPEQDWGRLLANVRRIRSTILYTDASDQPRSTQSLLQRFLKLELKDIAVGGVMGAKQYDPDLDIVGAPRLDLCVHCPDNKVDLGFVQRLDPGLERMQNPRQPARLAIHFIRRQDPLFKHGDDGILWADPVECLLELYHARLDQQARSFQQFLITHAKEMNGESR